ncbi:hypothetical protein CDAR_545741 [Caerostris darwini]|uniref:Uncharacterized protein n=1 Tax=Caerostris darwini TaxID=1538125 RepID=A0AAV4WXZ3_9ARAC|nr:hypothetical protein CDAR_545741 [Caerostris darwini]
MTCANAIRRWRAINGSEHTPDPGRDKGWRREYTPSTEGAASQHSPLLLLKHLLLGSVSLHSTSNALRRHITLLSDGLAKCCSHM